MFLFYIVIFLSTNLWAADEMPLIARVDRSEFEKRQERRIGGMHYLWVQRVLKSCEGGQAIMQDQAQLIEMCELFNGIGWDGFEIEGISAKLQDKDVYCAMNNIYQEHMKNLIALRSELSGLSIGKRKMESEQEDNKRMKFDDREQKAHPRSSSSCTSHEKRKLYLVHDSCKRSRGDE